jgi:hypothetical protein
MTEPQPVETVVLDEVVDPLPDSGSTNSHVVVERFDGDGNLVERFEGHNIVTQVGDQLYGERGAGVSGAAAAPTGMKLGTGGTAASKTGAGAALVTYLATSNKAFDGTYPQSAVKLAATAPATTYDARKITYRRTYAPGEATTASPIQEVVIVNDTIGTDATSVAANTIHRVLLTGISQKQAADTLTVTVDYIQGGQ